MKKDSTFRVSIHKFKRENTEEIIQLFQQTVLSVNARDYNAEQLAAWININGEEWKRRLVEPETFVAWKNQKIVGFCALRKTGEVDFIFVHKNFLRRGVASKLYSTMEIQAKNWGLQKLYADVSITARPFFEKKGFSVLREQLVERQEQSLKNYRMEKRVV